MAARPGPGLTRLHRAPASADDEADMVGHRNAPMPEDACLHGLVGEVARAGSEDAETHAHAIAALHSLPVVCDRARRVQPSAHAPPRRLFCVVRSGAAARAMRCRWCCASTRFLRDGSCLA